MPSVNVPSADGTRHAGVLSRVPCVGVSCIGELGCAVGAFAGSSLAMEDCDGAEGDGLPEEDPHPVKATDIRMAESTYAVFL